MTGAAFVGLAAGGLLTKGRHGGSACIGMRRHEPVLRRSSFIAQSEKVHISGSDASKPKTNTSGASMHCSLDTGLALAELTWIPYAITATEVGLNVFNFLMVVRIILSWYPQTRLQEQPWIFVAVPTEPLLAAMRKLVKPMGGVDISPIVWFAIGSFLHEILVGQQGLLILVQKYF